MLKSLQDHIEARKAVSGRIWGLDGLRALSISFVVFGHFFRLGEKTKGWSLFVCPFSGTTGVCIFFVISGFLITTLLLREREKKGRISFPNFVLRRTLRIFPPFYIYIALVFTFATIFMKDWDKRAFLFSATYLYNFSPYSDHLVGHTWSLSVEEQFYLFWPVVLILAPRLAGWLALLGIGLWPILRYLRHGFLAYGTAQEALNVAALDTILWGCLLALAWSNPQGRKSLEKLVSKTYLVYLVLGLFYLLYALKGVYSKDAYILLPVLRNTLICLIVCFAAMGPSRFQNLLENPILVYIGMISYSLYLWQQPFWHASLPGGSARFLSLIAATILAMLSYHLVECTCEKWKKKLPF